MGWACPKAKIFPLAGVGQAAAAHCPVETQPITQGIIMRVVTTSNFVLGKVMYVSTYCITGNRLHSSRRG